MEPISYRDALRRRWPVIPAVALVAALIGALFPLHVPYPPPHTQYEASILIGVTPGSTQGSTSINGPHVSIQQIVFFAANEQVIVDAAKSVGIKGKPDALEADISISSAKKKKKSVTPSGTIKISVKQPSAKKSAELTTAFVQSLSRYIDQRLAAQHQSDIRQAEQKVSNLSDQLQNLESQLQALLPTPTTTTTTTTTTTHRPEGPERHHHDHHDHDDRGAASAATGLGTTDPTTTTRPPAATTGLRTSTSEASEPVRGGPTGGIQIEPRPGALQQQSPSSAPRTGRARDVNNLRQTRRRDAGDRRLQPALAKNAKKIPAKVSVSQPSLRPGAARPGGRCRGGRRPRLAPRRPRQAPPDRGPDPGDARVSRSGRDTRDDRPDHRPPGCEGGTEPSVAVAVRRLQRTDVDRGRGVPHATDGDPPAAGHRLRPVGIGDSEHRCRDVILVVSAGAEPTRALVVTNLAAAFAEAGSRRCRHHGRPASTRPPADTMVMAVRGPGHDPRHGGGSYSGHGDPRRAQPGARKTSRRVRGSWRAGSPAILASARQDADVVIVDAPLLAVHDAEALVPAVDIVVAVVQSWWTRVDQGTKSGAFLRRIAAPVVGAALTEVHFGRKTTPRLERAPAPTRTTRTRWWRRRGCPTPWSSRSPGALRRSLSETAIEAKSRPNSRGPMKGTTTPSSPCAALYHVAWGELGNRGWSCRCARARDRRRGGCRDHRRTGLRRDRNDDGKTERPVHDSAPVAHTVTGADVGTAPTPISEPPVAPAPAADASLGVAPGGPPAFVTPTTEAEVAQDLIAAIDAQSNGVYAIAATQDNLSLLESWMANEGGLWADNPLNTSLGTGRYPHQITSGGQDTGIPIFPDIIVGIDATAETLLSNGVYAAILTVLEPRQRRLWRLRPCRDRLALGLLPLRPRPHPILWIDGRHRHRDRARHDGVSAPP